MKRLLRRLFLLLKCPPTCGPKHKIFSSNELLFMLVLHFWMWEMISHSTCIYTTYKGSSKRHHRPWQPVIRLINMKPTLTLFHHAQTYTSKIRNSISTTWNLMLFVVSELSRRELSSSSVTCRNVSMVLAQIMMGAKPPPWVPSPQVTLVALCPPNSEP